jgi:diguanylate cyclase (GGDEF)-like protein/putative nucleotidyltransferase with HDIG domain
MKLRAFLLIGLTFLFIVLNSVFPFGTLEHEVVMHSFFVVMVVTAFFELRLLFPVVVVYVFAHIVQDGLSHGMVPFQTWSQSFVHLLAATVLYKVLKQKDAIYNDKYRLIEQMDLGHAHYEGAYDEKGILKNAYFISTNTAFEAMLGKLISNRKKNPSINKVFERFPVEWSEAFLNVLKNEETNETSLYVPSLKKYFRLSFYIPRPREGAVLVRDITKYKHAARQISYLNRHDSLTGFYNREYLIETIKTYSIEHGNALGVILFDIDNLEILNRMFDTSAGDEAIKLASNIIKAFSREEDALFRYGGDEFVLLSKNPDIDALNAIARDITLEFSSRDVNQISLTMTSGVAIKRKDDEDKAYIMAEAEEALYNRKTVQMNSSHIQTLKGLLELLTAKFSYEKSHSERVSRLSQKLAESLGLSDLEIQETRVAAMFHDIGKIAIPDTILAKPSPLNEEEYESIKKHASIGYKILMSAAPKTRLCEYVLHHHERYDGTGYPDGLEGESIPLISRIISVVDAYEAMTSVREYSPSMKKEDAIREIRANMGTQFDPKIAKMFIEKTLTTKEG